MNLTNTKIYFTSTSSHWKRTLLEGWGHESTETGPGELHVLPSKGISLKTYTALLWVPLVPPWLPTFTWSTLKSWPLALSSPFLSRNGKGMWMMFLSSSPKVRGTLLQYPNSINPHIKFTVEQPKSEGAIPFLDTLPKPNGNTICLSIQKTYTLIGTWTLTPATLSWPKEPW